MKSYAFHVIIIVFMSMLAFGAYAATIMIDPATQETPAAGGTITVDVNVMDVTGLFGYQLDLVFDNTALNLSTILEGEFLGSDGVSTFAFVVSGGEMIEFENVAADTIAAVNSAGVLSIVGTRVGSAVNVDGTGELATVTFAVLEAKASTLELQNVLAANSDAQPISVDSENGVVEEAATIVIKGDVNGDGNVRSNDAILALRISSGLMVPTAEQAQAADMSGDGNVRSNDAILILRQAAGLTAPGAEITARSSGQISVTLAEAYGVAGEKVTVPVKVDSVYGLAGGDISISYDQAVLRVADISSDPHMLLASNVKEPGIVRISFASNDGLDNETLAEIEFDVLADDTSPLTFRMADLYGPDALPLNSRSISKEFRSWAIPPEESKLLQNFPNPFNPETWIPYQLKDAGEVTIRIYNTAGEQVRALDLGYKSPGLYVSQDRAAYWDGRNNFGTSVASGVYFYSIQTGDLAAVRKLIVLK